jgi:hypothetical protein
MFASTGLSAQSNSERNTPGNIPFYTSKQVYSMFCGNPRQYGPAAIYKSSKLLPNYTSNESSRSTGMKLDCIVKRRSNTQTINRVGI